MSTKQTLNAVTVGRCGPQSVDMVTTANADGTHSSAPAAGDNAMTMVIRTRPCGAQRFQSYNPTNPETEVVPLP